MSEQPIDSLASALASRHPELDAVREAAGAADVYLVGGCVRDLLLGRERTDVDLVVIGDAATLASALGAETLANERFGTVKVRLGGHEIDIASARAESYPYPGALPEVRPSPDIATDLKRRDFTINAMAIPLREARQLIDPYGGREDLAAGRLRVLSSRSFEDDPTRALRAARYAARFGFELEPETAALLRKADLSTVSADRRDADLLRLASEPNAEAGFAMLAEWGLVSLRPGGIELAGRVAGLLAGPPWRGTVEADRAILAAALGPPGGELGLSETRPDRPSRAVELARRHDPLELLLARALGAEWLDAYMASWRNVRLEIDGDDLIAAGLAEGPALGRGLAEALRRKLDGEIAGRDEELTAALAAARSGSGGADALA